MSDMDTEVINSSEPGVRLNYEQSEPVFKEIHHRILRSIAALRITVKQVQLSIMSRILGVLVWKTSLIARCGIT